MDEITQYEKDLAVIVACKLKENEKTDMRLLTLNKQRANAVKKNDINRIAAIDSEYEERRKQIADMIVKSEISKSIRERTIANYMATDKDRYLRLRDSALIMTEVLDTIFMDIRDIVSRHTYCVNMECHTAFKEVQKAIKDELKGEYELYGEDIREIISDEADKLTEHILERARITRNKINKLNKQHINGIQ